MHTQPARRRAAVIIRHLLTLGCVVGAWIAVQPATAHAAAPEPGPQAGVTGDGTRVTLPVTSGPHTLAVGGRPPLAAQHPSPAPTAGSSPTSTAPGFPDTGMAAHSTSGGHDGDRNLFVLGWLLLVLGGLVAVARRRTSSR